MSRTAKDIPNEVIDLAYEYAGIVKGDRSSIFLAQWILETNWGQSDFCRIGNNLGGMKLKSPKTNQHQTGISLDGIHAAYKHKADFCLDRNATLDWYDRMARSGQDSVHRVDIAMVERMLLKWNVMRQLARWWCFADKNYRAKMEHIIGVYDLTQFDSEDEIAVAVGVAESSATEIPEPKPEIEKRSIVETVKDVVAGIKALWAALQGLEILKYVKELWAIVQAAEEKYGPGQGPAKMAFVLDECNKALEPIVEPLPWAVEWVVRKFVIPQAVEVLVSFADQIFGWNGVPPK